MGKKQSEKRPALGDFTFDPELLAEIYTYYGYKLARSGKEDTDPITGKDLIKILRRLRKQVDRTEDGGLWATGRVAVEKRTDPGYGTEYNYYLEIGYEFVPDEEAIAVASAGEQLEFNYAWDFKGDAAA